MKQKGQIITVDFVFSLIMLMLALGYTFRIAEANEYRLKEEQMFNDLQRIGSAASELMIASPDFACEVSMGSTQYFSHCVNGTKLSGAGKDELGIPDTANYHFEILIGGSHETGENAPDPSNMGIAAAGFIYSEERKVLLKNAGNPTINELESCFNGGACAPTTADLMIKVWKT